MHEEGELLGCLHVYLFVGKKGGGKCKRQWENPGGGRAAAAEGLCSPAGWVAVESWSIHVGCSAVGTLEVRLFCHRPRPGLSKSCRVCGGVWSTRAEEGTCWVCPSQRGHGQHAVQPPPL